MSPSYGERHGRAFGGWLLLLAVGYVVLHHGGTIFAVDSDQHLTNSIVGVQPAGGTLLARWLGKDLFIESKITGNGPLSFGFGGGASGPLVWGNHRTRLKSFTFRTG